MSGLTRRHLVGSMFAVGAASAIIPADLNVHAASVEAEIMTALERQHRTQVILQYLEQNARKLLRPAMGVMRHPSIAPSLPGRQYSASLWDWDTLWTSRGLLQFAQQSKDKSLLHDVLTHSKGSLLNFLDHQGRDGRLPISMTGSDSDVFHSVNVPDAHVDTNQAKPVFGQLAFQVAQTSGDVMWFADLFPSLLRFYDSWQQNNLSHTGLLVWGNDVAIGVDNDPATFGRPSFSSANLLLNSLYVMDMKAAAAMARQLRRENDAKMLEARAESITQALHRECWDERDQFFYTVDVQCEDRRLELIGSKGTLDMSWDSVPIKLQSFTGFLPLWSGVASATQADKLVRANYLADDRFCSRFGVRTLSRLEKMYCMDFSSNPSNWLGPVWTLANYLVWKALARYGFEHMARSLADKTILLLSEDIATSGSMNEYYHPDTGKPLSHAGFMDWNLLVVEMF